MLLKKLTSLLLIPGTFSFANKKKNLVDACFRLEAVLIHSVEDFGSVVRYKDGALSTYISVCQIAKMQFKCSVDTFENTDKSMYF